MQYHILVVDDDLFGREMTVKLLTAGGYRVSQAVDGEDALRKVADDPPHLILMDMSLPRLTGWEATRRLKAGETTRNIPVIALTAHAMRGDKEKTLEVGCNDYISKPLDFEQLKLRLARLLPGHKP